jgi:peptidyl-prolyl cis-trans isomerase C
MQIRNCAAAALVVAVACHSVKTAAGGSGAQAETEPIATVNGAPVPLQRFNALYRARADAAAAPGKLSPEAASSIKREVAQQLVEGELVEQEARRRGVAVTDAEVAAQMGVFAASFPDRGSWERYLAQYPGGAAEIAQHARQNALRDKLSGFDAGAPITDRDARAFYVDVRRPDGSSFEQARPQIERTLRAARRSTAWWRLLASLRSSARIEEHLRDRIAAPLAANAAVPNAAATKPLPTSHLVPVEPH